MNAIITEGEDDVQFLAAIAKELNTVQENTCSFQSTAMKSLSKRKLVLDLKAKINEITRGKIRRIGLVIDQDTHSLQERLDFLNEVVEEAYGSTNVFQTTNTLYTIPIEEDTTVELACYFMNVEGTGELETVLRAIKTQPSPHADCLEAWQGCILEKGKTLTEKQFIKLWIGNYVRLHTCFTSKFRKNVGEYCSINRLDNILARTGDKITFDLQHPTLNPLKEFLRLFPNK
ncbi:MAG: DUF3226 domain-containing protein [Aureispira sp.]